MADAEDITGTVAGNGFFPEVRGIAWSSVRTLKGAATDGTVADGRDVDEIASHYRAADITLEKTCHWKRLPWYRPAFPWEYCAECRLGFTPRWLWVIEDLVFSVGPDGSRDVTDHVSAVARDLLASGATRVLASEPDTRLIRSELTRRELVVDTATLGVIGTIGIANGQVHGVSARDVVGVARTPDGLEAADRVFPAAIATGNVGARCDNALAYSAVRNELFALTRAPGETETTLGIWSAGRWTERPLDGAAIGYPLSLAFHIESSSLYVLDQGQGLGSHVRLVRIDLVTNHVEILEPRLLVGKYDALSLSVAPDGKLLLAASRRSPKRVRLAHLLLAGGFVRVVDRLEIKGEVFAGEVRESRHGIGFLVEVGDGLEPRIVLPAELLPVDNDAETPVFP